MRSFNSVSVDRFIEVTKMFDRNEIIQILVGGGVICGGRVVYFDLDVVVDFLEVGEIVSPKDQIRLCSYSEASEKIHAYLESLGRPYQRVFFKSDEHFRLKDPVITAKDLRGGSADALPKLDSNARDMKSSSIEIS